MNKFRTIASRLHLDHFSEELLFESYFRLKSETLLNIDDNYANHRDFGFYTNDDHNARNHAYLMLEKLHSSPDASEEQQKKWKETLVRDFENYMLCIAYMASKPKLYVERLCEAMIAYDLDDNLIASIRSYYKQTIREDDRGYYVPAFEDLFIKAGDRALFIQQNIEKALKYYQLADIDWFHLRDEQDESELDSMRRQKLLRWHDTVVFYQRLEEGRFEPEEILSETNIERRIGELFIQFELLIREREQNGKITEAATDFLMTLDKMLEQKDAKINNLRDSVLMALLLKRSALLPALCCLEEESLEAQQGASDEIIDAIKRIDSIPLRIVKSYVINNEGNAKLANEIISFSLAIDTIDQIRCALSVDKVTQDVAYYTTIDNLFFMLPARCEKPSGYGRLSIMNIAYMNDPNEGVLLQKFLNKGEELYADNTGRKSAIYPYVFMKCFTSRIDDLPMWEMYGGHAEGCCILLDWDASMQGAKAETIPLYRVCYIKKNQSKYSINRDDNPLLKDLELVKKGLNKLRNLLSDLATDDARSVFKILLQGIMYLFKDSSYHYEQETRILFVYSDVSEEFNHTVGEYPMLYVQPNLSIHMKEIILGPKFRNVPMRIPYIQEQVAKMAREINANMPVISLSRIEYR